MVHSQLVAEWFVWVISNPQMPPLVGTSWSSWIEAGHSQRSSGGDVNRPETRTRVDLFPKNQVGDHCNLVEPSGFWHQWVTQPELRGRAAARGSEEFLLVHLWHFSQRSGAERFGPGFAAGFGWPRMEPVGWGGWEMLNCGWLGSVWVGKFLVGVWLGCGWVVVGWLIGDKKSIGPMAWHAIDEQATNEHCKGMAINMGWIYH